MQTHGGAAAAAAITSRERSFRARVSIDWNNNGLYDHELSVMDGYVADIQTDRTLKGAAPEEVLLIEGSSSAEFTLNVQGMYAGQSLAALFSPYNRTSPFFLKQTVGSEVTYSLLVDTAFGTFEYPQFVGYVRTITPDRRTNNVEITALDRAETMRRPVQFPPWAIDEWHTNRDIVEPQLVDSSWVIDHCLRISDASVTPLRPTYKEEIGGTDDSTDGVQLWVSGTGALIPTIGWMARGETEQQYVNSNTSGLPIYENQGKRHPDAPSTALPLNVVGQGDLAAAPVGEVNQGALNRWWSVDRDKIQTNGTHYFGFTLCTAGVEGDWYKTAQDHFVMLVDVGSNCWLLLWIGNGRVWATRWNASSGTTVFTSSKVLIPDQDYVDIEVIWDNTPQTGSRCFIRAGANAMAGFQTLGSGISSTTFTVNKGIVQVNPTVSFNDMYYAFRNASGVSTDSSFAKRPAKNAAHVDNGIQSLSFLPTRGSEDAWDIVTEVAASEFGAVFWDEAGKFNFWNYETIVDKQDTIVRTYSIEDFSDLTITNTFDSVRNIWSVEAEKWSSSFTLAYESNSVEEFYTPRNTIRRFKLWVDDIQAPDQFDLLRYRSENDAVLAGTGWQVWTDAKIHGYCIQYYDGGVWKSRDSGSSFPKVNTYYQGDGSLVVQVNNNTGYPIRFATTEAESNSEPRPAFRIRGTKIRKSDPLVATLKNQESIDRYGGRNLTVSGPWVQDWFSQDAMRSTLMPRMLNPIPVTDAIVVPGDPRIQLGDCVTLADEAGFGETMNAQVFGVSRKFAKDEGLTDTLTIEMLEPPLGSGVIEDPDPVSDITFVSQSFAKRRDHGNTLEVPAPPEMAVGDYMIAVQECTYNASASGMTRPDSSWVQLGSAVTPSGSFHPHTKVYGKRVTEGEDSKFVFGIPSDLNSNNTISITAWRGVHPTDAFDVDPVFGVTTQTTGQTFGGLTTTLPDSMLVVHWLSQRYAASQDNYYEYPTPQMKGRPTVSSTFVYQGMAYELRSATGATGSRVATANADPGSPGRTVAYALRSA